jgi:acetyl-CoA C-acetyltransferase
MTSPSFTSRQERRMSIRGQAHIAGPYEHPDRKIPDKSVAQVHAEVAVGALKDAGLTTTDVDAYFCAADAPGFGPISMAEYLGLKNLRYVDSTETGGASYLTHVGHAAAAMARREMPGRAHHAGRAAEVAARTAVG